MKKVSYFIVSLCIILFISLLYLANFLAQQTSDGVIDNPFVILTFRSIEAFVLMVAIAIIVYEHPILHSLKLFISKTYKQRDRIFIVFGKIALSVIVLCLSIIFIEKSVSDNMVVGSFDKKFPMENTRVPYPYIMFKGRASGKLNKDDVGREETFSENEVLNTNGYRGNVPSVSKDSLAYRIFFVGGSTVFNGHPSIAGAVEELCWQDGFSHVEAFNYGVVSSVTNMDLARLVYEISAYSPDLVIFYGGGNDIFTPYSSDPRPGYPFNFIAYENNPYFLNGNYDLIPLILYKSNFLRYSFNSYFLESFADLSSSRQKVNYNSIEWKDKIASEYMGALSKANKIASAFNANFVGVFQPISYYKDSLTASEKIFTSPDFFDDAFYIRNKINSSQKDFNFLDLSDIFDSHPEQAFVDNIHITQASYIPVAASIYKHISPILYSTYKVNIKNKE